MQDELIERLMASADGPEAADAQYRQERTFMQYREAAVIAAEQRGEALRSRELLLGFIASKADVSRDS